MFMSTWTKINRPSIFKLHIEHVLEATLFPISTKSIKTKRRNVAIVDSSEHFKYTCRPICKSALRKVILC